MEVLKSIKLRGDGLDEVVDLIGSAKGSELGQPDRLSTASLVGLLEVGEQSIGSRSLMIPVHVAEVNSAASLLLGAGIHESLEPLNTLSWVLTVGDGRSANQGLAGVLVHVLFVSGSGHRRRDIGLSGIVTLVEAEHGLAATFKRLGGHVIPALSVDRNRAPEHGNKAELGVETTGALAPVVAPAAAGTTLTESVGEFHIIVGQASLARKARTGTRVTSRGLGGGGRRCRSVVLGSWGVDLARGRLGISLQSGGLLGCLVLGNLNHGSGSSLDDGCWHIGDMGDGRRLGLAGLDIDGFIDGDPVGDDGSLVNLVLRMDMTMRVEGRSGAGEGGDRSQSESCVGTHFGWL